MTDIARIGITTNINTQAGSPQAFNHTLVAGSGGGNRMVMVALSGASTNAPVYSVTYGGVAMTELAFNRFAAGNLNEGIWYILEADLPADGVNSVSISWTGGTGNQMIVACDTAENTVQIAPAVEYNSVVSGLTVTTEIDSGTNTWSFAAVNSQENGQNWTHNEGQAEIQDSGGSSWTGAATSTIYPTSHTGTFSSTKTGTSVRLQRTHAVVQEDPAAIARTYATTVVATSTVTATMDIPRKHSTTIVGTSGTTISLHRNRGYVTTVAVAPSVVTATLVRNVAFDSLTTATATVTPLKFLRGGEFSTVIEIAATVSGFFQQGGIRFATTIAATSAVTAQFGSNFNETTTSLTPGDYVELYEIDTTVIGGGDVFRFIPYGYEGVEFVEWQGQQFTRFPITADGFEWNASSSAPPQPTLQLSNVNKFVLSAVIGLGDLVGAKVTRWRTYARFLDLGDTPDPNAHFPPDIYFVQQKSVHNKVMMEWKLSSVLDLPGINLPRRQILKDQTTGNLYAPGVSSVRFKGR